ncbi:MAG: efflux RND transporter permease subunit [Bacteriovoracaceae bacterium]|nr:efflux RND transporter permease subunit [Bacteriovoracaceae bacterium]
MKNLISFFSTRHLLTNVIFFGVILMGIFTWFNIGKEEMPEFESNWIRVRTIYPGAPAEDVELFVTKPLEDELKGVVGIEELRTTSSVGVSSLRITLDDDFPDKDEVTQEIKDAILRTNLPSEVRDIPKIRQFKSAEKAILDIGLYYKGKQFLDTKSRKELQKYVLGFESQILSLNEISSVSKSHYRKPELKILVNPKENARLELSLSEIRSQIKDNNIRVPIGSMQDRGESKVTAINELETVEDLNNLILRGNYEGLGIKLSELAHIEEGFERSTTIFKINGHEGIFLNIKKSVSTDILSAQSAVMKFIKDFKKANKDAPLGIVLMDDESYDVVNRLDIISKNGMIGFVLIISILLMFLNAKSGLWVAMGIPFSMGFTLIIAHLMGYTVNNMTLAGIIIVLGIVVDDAIIIAENISRKREEGLSLEDASIVGAAEVIRPIFASIVTTCVAFVPLMFFEGFFGKLVSYIPAVVILMLIGSLLESMFVLPAHLSGKNKLLDRFNKKENENSWFHRVEKKYAKFLMSVFKVRIPILLAFVVLLGGSIALYKAKMKFVMFPREESKEVFLKVKAKKGTVRQETAKIIAPLEEMFVSNTANVVGVRSTIGLSRRGGEVKEHEASILVELVPYNDRPASLDDLLKEWEEKSKGFEGIDKVRFLRGRWGHSSGNSIEILVQENDDKNRAEIAKFLEEKMKESKDITDVELEVPLLKNEFLFKIKQDQLIKYNVSPAKVTSTLRSFVEGSILYSINKGEEEVDVRLSVPDESKNALSELLKLRVENKQGQLVYLNKLVEIETVKRPVSISRTNFKRTTKVYANAKEGGDLTPLQIAEMLEDKVFPEILNKFPTAILKFKGEIEDTRESQGEFKNSVFMVIILIYLILVVMFNSLYKPFLVLSIVPFGLAGVIFVLYFHGMNVYGFFAAIGALGMIGVVINDAIVMIDKIERTSGDTWGVIAQVASTRLRPIIVTTMTTVVGILPTAYGLAGYDSMLAEMMLTMGWGLAFGTLITLIFIPCLYSFIGKREA